MCHPIRRARRERLTPDEKKARREKRLAAKLAVDLQARSTFARRRGYQLTTDQSLEDATKLVANVGGADAYTNRPEDWLRCREYAVALALGGWEYTEIAEALDLGLTDTREILLAHGSYIPHWRSYTFTTRKDLRIAAPVPTTGKNHPSVAGFLMALGSPELGDPNWKPAEEVCERTRREAERLTRHFRAQTRRVTV